MGRWLAGIAAILLFVTGTVLALTGGTGGDELPVAPQPRLASVIPMSEIPQAPKADAKSKEEKRFARADKDENGRVTLAEMVEPRRKAFGKLDSNSDGNLSFEEWSVKTIKKFGTADANKDDALSPVEFASTAPKPKRKPICRC
jgi:hypothetical protein